ncbi:MAG: DUF4157 domain-containing protein [Anaerolineales bacterium]|nr:DUF4157 domain-containing protein [Anaerolineales bacterium]
MSRRSLSSWELGECRRVFGESIAWERVQVFEDRAWPRWLSAVGAKLRRQPPPAHNAVTLGHRMYFSRRLNTHPGGPQPQRRSDLAWLVHELTHVWQYERHGPRALRDAAKLHLGSGVDPYAYGGEAGLSPSPAPKSLADFNMEQQAEIAGDYYSRLASGQDTQAWEPFVERLRRR